MNHDWEKDYSKYGDVYKDFQGEAITFVKDLAEKHKGAIDIASINQRPGNKIKSKQSIKSNHLAKKYDSCKTFFNIKDIAGVRVTCHCEEDVENFTTLLEGELLQQYMDVRRKIIGGKEIDEEGNKYPYRAVHLTFSKPIRKNTNKIKLFCEIQIRTVMADAWAVQNHKYLYKQGKEGESHELTAAVSEIMNGCEKLWSLVKKKSRKGEAHDYSSEISEIHKKADTSLKKIQKSDEQLKALKEWFIAKKQTALDGLHSLGIKTFMEVKVDLPLSNLDIPKKLLDESARNSTISTFGWPIGIYFNNRDEFSPKPDPNGIHAEIAIKNNNEPNLENDSYDYWAIHTSGAFFLLKSLFEDSRKPDSIFFNTRIIRITELFMYLKKLYSNFEVPINEEIDVSIKHGDLKGKMLSSSSPRRPLFRSYKIDADEVHTKIKTSLNEIESDMVSVVEQFTKPLFEQFSFFELDRKVLEEIVDNYIQGKVV